MIEVEDLLLDLPEDPELQFVVYERRLRDRMWNKIQDSQSFEYDKDQKIYYINKIMAFHDAHEFRMLERPNLPRRSKAFDQIFDEFTDAVDYWTTQIQIRHANRLRQISTILRLTDDAKSKIHTYIGKIREVVTPVELKPAKKEALFKKLRALEEEVDRDRTNTEAWTSVVLEVAGATGEAADKLKPARRMLDSIGNMLGQAKDIMERLGLPSPSTPKRIEAQTKQLPPSEHEDIADLDDEIPF